MGRHGAGRGRADDGAAAAQQFVLAQQDCLAQGPGGGDADGAHKGRFGDADAGQLRRLGEPVAHFPMGDVGFEVQVAQEAEAGQDGGEAPLRRFDVADGDFQQVARFGAVDVDRAG